MFYQYINNEERNFQLFETLEDVTRALEASRSLDVEIFRVPESPEEFINLTREKYGKDVIFRLGYEAEDPHEYGYIQDSSNAEKLLEEFKKLSGERRLSYAVIFLPKRRVVRYVISSEYDSEPQYAFPYYLTPKEV